MESYRKHSSTLEAAVIQCRFERFLNLLDMDKKRMNYYSLYDCKADAYTPPFLAKNDEMAKRQLVASFDGLGASPLTDYPADFTLLCIGSWDDATGVIKPLDAFINLGTVLQIVNVAHSAPKVTPIEVE